ncbi:MAG TPA: PAS domain S-box protein [Segetibacter sp.]
MLTNRILLVGADVEHFDTLIKMLSFFGLKDSNFFACNSLAALSSQEIATFSPNFIFVDLHIEPSSRPINVYQAVQEKFSSVPVVVVTEKGNAEMSANFIKAGAQSFLIKGQYHREQLYSIVTHAIERNNLRQELKRLKSDYQALFENNPLATFVVEKNTYRFIAVNKAAQQKYGYTEEEFRKLQFSDIEEPLLNASVYLEKKDKNYCSYKNHYKKNGDVLHVETTSTCTFYNNCDSLLITVNDITEKVLAAAEETKATQRLNAIFNGTHDAIFLTDDQGYYVQVNPAACIMLGYSEDELLSLKVSDVVKQPTGNSDRISKILSGNQSHSSVLELKRKDGSAILCFYNAVANILPGLHVSIVTNITERENARRKIVEQGRNIQNILESITDCFVAVDKDWTVTYWNKAMENFLHLERDLVLGKNLWEVYPKAVNLKLYEQFHYAVKHQVPVHFEEYFPVSRLWAEVSVFPTSEGLTVYIKDVTIKKKRAQEILEAKNNQDALINATNDIIWSVDTDLRLLSFNAAFARRVETVTGLKIYEGLQLPIEGMHSIQNMQNWEGYYQRALNGEVFSVDETFRDAKNDFLKRAEITFNPISAVNANGITGVACYSHDITLRMKNQTLIEEQNEKLRLHETYLERVSAKLKKVLDSSIDVICSINANGDFVQVSEASKSVWGYAPEELIGKSFLLLVAPESEKATRLAAVKVMAGKVFTNFKNYFIHKAGHPVPLTWSAKWDEEEKTMFTVARDASATIIAEKIKAETEQRFTALVQKGADLVGILDKAGNYLYVSPNIKAILGYHVSAMIGSSALSFIHPDDVDNAVSELGKVTSEVEVKLAEFRFKHANGEWRWIETIATNQLNNPAIKGIVVNSRDVTARKQIEAERELMIKELLKSNADLKQFSFITSHNLRAPLSNIIGILNIINYDALDDHNREMVQLLDASSKQLGQTIDDLASILIIKNKVNIEITDIDLEDVFNQVSNIFLNTLNDICSKTTTDFRAKNIAFSKTYFESILVNLISNAIKYRSPLRSLVIDIRSYLDDKGNTIFQFSDNGSGIDLRRHKNAVFGLYQRFHNHSEGQGLGLFIIKSQIVALGGKIDIESEVDKGTTFTITFKNSVHASSAATNKQKDFFGALESALQ